MRHTSLFSIFGLAYYLQYVGPLEKGERFIIIRSRSGQSDKLINIKFVLQVDFNRDL